MRKKRPYSKFFWCAFSRIRTVNGEIQNLVRIQSECGKIRTRKTLDMDTFYTGLMYETLRTSGIFWAHCLLVFLHQK